MTYSILEKQLLFHDLNAVKVGWLPYIQALIVLQPTDMKIWLPF
jgi:hypothetical protein